MKWLFLPVLWLLATCLAVFVLYRLWRGKPTVLRGGFSPRVVRMAVILLVILGVGVTRKSAPESTAAPLPVKPENPNDAALPEALTTEVIGTWIAAEQPTSNWSKFKRDYVRIFQMAAGPERKILADHLHNQAVAVLPEAAQGPFNTELAALTNGKPVRAAAAADLLAALAAAERVGIYDHWLNAFLWRRSATVGDKEDRETVVQLYARLNLHARVTNTLIRAQARVRPVYQPPRAWMGKGGRPPLGWDGGGGVSKDALNDMMRAAKELHATSDTGTWKRDGLALMKLGKDSARPTLIRGGKKRVLTPEETVRLGRLDLLETPAGDKAVELEHAWVGSIKLPGGRLTTVWDLARHLSDDAMKKARETVREALANDEDAADKLEQALPLVHAVIREELKRSPDAKGAPRLRLILALFDDAVMPALAPTAPAPPAEGLIYGPGRPK
jgi:hypothetical protein